MRYRATFRAVVNGSMEFDGPENLGDSPVEDTAFEELMTRLKLVEDAFGASIDIEFTGIDKVDASSSAG